MKDLFGLSIIIFGLMTCNRDGGVLPDEASRAIEQNVKLTAPVYLFGPNDQDTQAVKDGCTGKDCRIKIVHYTDLQCVHCEKASELLAFVFQKFPGQVRIESRPFITEDHYSLLKAHTVQAAYCAHDQELYWPMSDFLFANHFMSEVIDPNDISVLILDTLKNSDHRIKSSLDMDKFEACMANNAVYQYVDELSQKSREEGVFRTPTIYFEVDGQRLETHTGILTPTILEDYITGEDESSLRLWEYRRPAFLLACYYFNPSAPYTKMTRPRRWTYASSGTALWGFVKKYYALEGHADRDFFFVDDGKYAELVRVCNESIPDGRQLFSMKSVTGRYSVHRVIGEKKEVSTNNVFDRILVFGDSLSDNGNFQVKARFLPNKPYFMGRFSNGPVWPDYVTKILKIAVHNRAYGGSTSGSKLSLMDLKSFSKVKAYFQNNITGNMLQEVKKFRKGRPMIREEMEKTLGVIWTGANNFLTILGNKQKMKELSDRFQSDRGAVTAVIREKSKEIIDDIKEAMALLEQEGLQYFVLLPLPNLAETPMCLKMTDIAFSQEICQEISDNFLEELTQYTAGSDDYLLVNLADDFDKMIHDPDEVNNQNPLQSMPDFLGDIFGFGKDIKECYSGYYGLKEKFFGKKFELCTSTSKEAGVQHLFFDNVHPNTKAHCLVAHSLLQSLKQNGWLLSGSNFYTESQVPAACRNKAKASDYYLY